MSAASSLLPTPLPRQAASTAILPMCPSGSRRPVPIGNPLPSSATTWSAIGVHAVPFELDRHLLLDDEDGFSHAANAFAVALPIRATH